MTEYIHLLGAEEVGRAGASMRSAADDMQRAASNFQGAVDQLDRITQRLEQALERHAERLEAVLK